MYIQNNTTLDNRSKLGYLTCAFAFVDLVRIQACIYAFIFSGEGRVGGISGSVLFVISLKS